MSYFLTTVLNNRPPSPTPQRENTYRICIYLCWIKVPRRMSFILVWDMSWEFKNKTWREKKGSLCSCLILEVTLYTCRPTRIHIHPGSIASRASVYQLEFPAKSKTLTDTFASKTEETSIITFLLTGLGSQGKPDLSPQWGRFTRDNRRWKKRVETVRVLLEEGSRVQGGNETGWKGIYRARGEVT